MQKFSELGQKKFFDPYLKFFFCPSYNSPYFTASFLWRNLWAIIESFVKLVFNNLGVGCRIAGFLTVFASQLSVFTLALVTLERWFAITHAINLNRRIKLSMAAKIMAGGWIYCIIVAALPLFGFSNYSATR